MVSSGNRGREVVCEGEGGGDGQQAGRSSPPGTPGSGEGCLGCSELLAKLGLCLSLQPGAGGFHEGHTQEMNSRALTWRLGPDPCVNLGPEKATSCVKRWTREWLLPHRADQRVCRLLSLSFKGNCLLSPSAPPARECGRVLVNWLRIDPGNGGTISGEETGCLNNCLPACFLQTIRMREINHVLYSTQVYSLTNTLI